MYNIARAVLLTVTSTMPLFAESILFDVDLNKNDAGGGLICSGFAEGGICGTPIHPDMYSSDTRSEPVKFVPARNLYLTKPEGPPKFTNSSPNSWKWNNGFEIVDKGTSGGPRILYDMGKNIKNGRIEVSFTFSKSPKVADKINYMGIHEYWTVSHKHGGPGAYFRQGTSVSYFSVAKISDVAFLSNGDRELHIGQGSDLKTDGQTVYKAIIIWKDDEVTVKVEGLSGGGTVNKRNRTDLGPWKFDRIRWLYIGADGYYGVAIPGQRFTHVKIVDLDGTPGQTSIEKASPLKVHVASQRTAPTAWYSLQGRSVPGRAGLTRTTPMVNAEGLLRVLPVNTAVAR